MMPYQIPEDDEEFRRFNRTAYLIASFIENKLTPAERAELDQWVGASKENLLFFEEATDESRLTEALRWFQQLDLEVANRRILEKMKSRRSRGWSKVLSLGIAACVVLLVGVGIVLFLRQKERVQQPFSSITKETGVVLTLADGRIIYLDSVGDGRIKGSDKISINQEESLVSIDAGAFAENLQGMNTLLVPKGKQYKLVLPDGSRVELNAESALQFSSKFDGEEREVRLQGEGYFDVAKSKEHPFTVITREASITVMGTEFNVNAYEDEQKITTTLIEGSVKVKAEGKEVKLRPGDQAVFDGGQLQTLSNADLTQVSGWRNGLFVFRDVPLDEMLRILARWYDVEVVNEARVNEKFSGSFNKTWSLEKIMTYLEETKRVTYTLEGKRLKVSN